MFILIIFNLEHPIGPFERQLAQFWMSIGLLFIDNWVLYRKIYSLQECLILQEEFNCKKNLSSLGQWEADEQMKFNEARCPSMRVTRNKHHNQFHFDYSLHNPTFGNVQSIKYIGITITDNTKSKTVGIRPGN